MLEKNFLYDLRQALSFLPEKDIDDRIRFYREMIDDYMDEGLSEEEAVAALGSVEKAVTDTIEETPITVIVKKKMKPLKYIRVREIVLLALGAPLWLPLLIAGAAVVLSLYVSLWAVIISLWAVFVSCAVSAFGVVVGGVIVAVTQNVYSGLAFVAAGCICAGLSVFLFFGCKAVTKYTVLLTKKIVSGIKNQCVRKGETQ